MIPYLNNYYRYYSIYKELTFNIQPNDNFSSRFRQTILEKGLFPGHELRFPMVDQNSVYYQSLFFYFIILIFKIIVSSKWFYDWCIKYQWKSYCYIVVYDVSNARYTIWNIYYRKFLIQFFDFCFLFMITIRYNTKSYIVIIFWIIDFFKILF